MSGGVRGRRFALHHLWKKIPRRRAQLRGAKARTARYMRWLFYQKKDSVPLLLKYFGSLTTRWRADPPADFVRQKHPPRQDPLWETSSPVWRLRLPDPRKQSFSSPGYPPSWRRSFPRLELATMGALVRPYYPPPVSSFEGSGQGASSSIFSNTGFSKPSGRGAKHRIIFAFVSQSWSKSKLLEITSNKRQCVRLEDFLLVRQRGYCSGPRPR